MNHSDAVIPVSLRWIGDPAGHLDILDQTRLPAALEWRGCHDVEAVVEAIKSLRVRGAPAIGIAGAYGLVVAAGEAIRDDVFARLLTFPNVVVTGHQAFFTEDALRAIAETTIANVDAFEAAGRPLHAVSVERLA